MRVFSGLFIEILSCSTYLLNFLPVRLEKGTQHSDFSILY